MSQWIRWWGLGLFLAIVLLLWLGTNPLIQWSIESGGTQAVGAKVELDSVDLDLNPVTLELNRLQVTNPKAPMRNMVEAGRIEMALDGYALLRHQFVAENMAVEKLRFDTERSASGAIEGRIFSRKKKDEASEDGTDLAGMLPGAELPDPDQIVADERERLLGKVAEFDGEAKQIQQAWRDRIERLPSGDSVDQYRERWNELKGKDPLRRAAGVRELKKDIDEELDTVRSLDEQLDKDRQRLGELTEQARALPGEEADRLMAASGLDEGFRGVTRKLMGEQLNGWVDTGLTGYRLASKHMAGRKAKADEQSGPPRGEGENIRFPEDEPLPRFLIQRTAVDGVARMAGSSVDFNGEIRDITTEPAVWGRPMTLTVDGSGEKGTTLDVDGTFDHRSEPGRDQLDFRIQQLTLSDARFSGSSRLPIVLKEGRANIDGKLTVTGGELNGTVNTGVQQASFSAGGEDSSDTARRIARAIEGVSGFRLDLGLSGTLDSPKLSLDSNLDNIIGRALGDEVRAELAEARKELEQKLRAELKPKLEELAGRQQALAQYRERIDQRREALRDIRP
jgi:uncharacterized protein (TIGR03545 family)